MAKYTQRELLERALTRHECYPVKTLPSGWVQWTTGDILATPSNWFFVGTTGFRFGSKRTTSRDYPKLRAALIAEIEPNPF